mmetsp:Transcript_64094/g.198441  ORF Transcript_64094/g.198441 Transcript_64094/m.198441 type:complete len:87 (+) Transcript_64094:452-712(+)
MERHVPRLHTRVIVIPSHAHAVSTLRGASHHHHPRKCHRVLTISCPEAELEPARRLLCSAGCACRVILVPSEQSHYNRALFLGHVH